MSAGVDPGAHLVDVIRGGAVESVHGGHVAVVTVDGELLAGLGAPHVVTFPRSALKPFQTVASRDLLAAHGHVLSGPGLAIASASHSGTDDHQIEAAHLLALADLDEDALGCPPALPSDPDALARHGPATRLAHNCSGKHAAMLWATAAAGSDPAAYLDLGSPGQQAVHAAIAEACGTGPVDPSVDGCGMPAWQLPLAALARGFARLADAPVGTSLGEVRVAMGRHPRLVGGEDAADTNLMRADRAVVAKRGAEGVLAVGLRHRHGPLGVAVKVADGAGRATGPVVAAVLEGLGARVPHAVAEPAVLGGGRRQGHLAVSAAVRDLARRLAAQTAPSA